MYVRKSSAKIKNKSKNIFSFGEIQIDSVIPIIIYNI